MPRPPAEVDLDETGLRALLHGARPGLATLPLVRVAEGWDNVTWRLGDRLAVRLPRHAAADALLATEQRWLPEIADRFPTDLVPVPVLRGTPAGAFPFRWSVVPWVEGATADVERLGPEGVADLARALRALHVTAPADAPDNPHRGIPLSQRADPLAMLGAASVEVTDPLRKVWADALAAAPAAGRTWIHADLHAHSIVVREGALAAIVDWGDLCGGDPAVDLSLLWTVLDHADTRIVFAEYGALGDGLRARARGWALVRAALLVGDDDPVLVAVGHRTLARLSA